MVGNKKIWYGIGLDNKSLQADANKSKQIFGGISNKVSQEGKKIDNTYKKLSKTIGVVFSTGLLAGFITKMAMVRGEFQQLEVAFTTMLGSKEKSDKLMAKTIDFAAKTPFDLAGVASGTKQLLAYGSEAESVTEELGMLGNVAAGLSIPLNDMVYLYGTTRTQGRLFTMDLRQFMGRGIPLAKELAKQFGVTKNEVAGLVTAGKVGFEHVEIAMKSLTAEGGMFFNLMEEQSKTITGKMSNLGDGIAQMFNKIGESNQDAMGGGLDLAIEMVENYEDVGKSIAELIALYGTYKAALIVTAAAQGVATQSAMGYTVAQQIQYKWALLNEAAAKALNRTMLVNPYVLVAAAVAGLAFMFYKLATAQSVSEKAQESINELIKKSNEDIAAEKQLINELIKILKDEVSTITQKQKALEALRKLKPSVFADMDIEAIKTMKLTELKKQLNKEYEKGTGLANKKLILDKKAEIARQKEIQATVGGSGGAEKYVYDNAEKTIKRLQAETKVLEKNLNIQDKIAERAKFNALPDSVKIAVKTNENVDYEKRLSGLGESSGPMDSSNYVRDAINENIKQNNILIQSYQKNIDSIDDTPLESRASKLKEIAEVQSAINALQEKSKTGIDPKEKGSLEEYKKALASLNRDLELFTGKKKTSSSSSKKDYDFVKVELLNNRKLEDAVYTSELKKLQIKKDGSEKSISILELENKRKIVLMNRQKDDSISGMETDKVEDKKENPNGHDAKAWEAKIQSFQTVWDKTINQQEELNKNSRNAMLKKKYAKDLTDYSDFVTSYIDKKNEFDENLKNMKDNGNSDAVISKTKSVQASILSELDEEMKMKEEVIVSMAEEMVGLGIEEIVDQLTLARESLKTELESGEDQKKIVVLKAKIKALRKLLGDKGKKQTKPVKDKDWTKTLKALHDIRQATNDVIDSFEGMSDETKEILKATTGVAGSAISMITGIKTLTNSASVSMTGTAAVSAEAIKGVERASVILAIIGAALQIVQAIISVIGGAKDKKKEKEVEKLQVQVDALKRSYDALEKSIDKAYSTDATQLMQQQNENLKQQKKLLESQIKKEGEKKKSDKDKINGWKDAIADIDIILAETEERQIEAINGKGVNDAIEDFADAYMDAWAAGEDKAKAMKDVVRNMVKSAISELVKSRMSGEVEAFSKYLASAMEDGILTLAETKVLDSLENSITNKMAGLSDTLDSYMVDEEDEERKSTDKGFSSMSQESADELNGRFATLQAYTFDMAESIKLLHTNSEFQLAHLAGIEKNTESLERLEKIENDIGLMSSGIEDMNDKGIIIRKN